VIGIRDANNYLAPSYSSAFYIPIALSSVAVLRIAGSSKPPSKRVGRIFSFNEHRPFVATTRIFRTDHDENVLFLCFPTSCVYTIEQNKIYNS
jgi:hypothetical protein